MFNKPNETESSLHASNIGEEERAKFTRRLSLEEIMDVLKNGSDGRKLLIKKADNPDDNVVVEYKKVSKPSE